MKRPLYVQQREELTEDGDAIFWYVVKGRNGSITSTSEMFPTRSNAVRAARRFIASIDPVSVRFTYWTGPHPTKDPNGTRRQRVTEHVR